MKTVKYLFLLTLVVTLFSCTKETADNVNQDKIWTEYYLEYNEATGITSARAVFKFSNMAGTLLELVDSASVSFNGDELAYNQLLGYYEKQYSSLVTTGTFHYQDLDGNVFENALDMTDPTTIPSISSISKSTPYTFTWDGPAVKANERINIWLDSNIEGDARIFTTDSQGSTSVIFGLNDLEKLGTGPYGQIAMERVFSPAITQATSAGGVTSSKFIAKKLTGINIED